MTISPQDFVFKIVDIRLFCKMSPAGLSWHKGELMNIPFLSGMFAGAHTQPKNEKDSSQSDTA
jgi:hypothetical protein